MSADDKNAKPKREDWTTREVIPIAAVQFDPQRPQPIPGKMYSSSVTADPKHPANSHHHRIVFIPSLRHYVIAYHPANGQAVQVRMVHESHVICAEPLL